MNHYQCKVTFDADPGRLRAAATVALARIGAVVVANENDSHFDPRIEAITEHGIFSIGENITIRFSFSGKVSIESHSRQWLTVFDWFANRRNVTRIERAMREHLDSQPKPVKPHPPAAPK